MSLIEKLKEKLPFWKQCARCGKLTGTFYNFDAGTTTTISGEFPICKKCIYEVMRKEFPEYFDRSEETNESKLEDLEKRVENLELYVQNGWSQ